MKNSERNINIESPLPGHVISFGDDSPSLKESIYSEIIKDGMLIMDVGARDSELPKLNTNCNYHLFEPIKWNYDNLVTKYNDFSNIKIINNGLSDVDETVEIYKESESIVKRLDYNYIWHRVNPTRVNDGITEEIICTKLCDYVISNDIEKIDLLKIDVEGYECKVLKGMGDHLKIVDSLIIEYSSITYKMNGFSLKNLMEILSDFDFYLIQDDYSDTTKIAERKSASVLLLDLEDNKTYEKISSGTHFNLFIKNRSGG